MRRRELLTTVGTATITTAAGCSNMGNDIPEVELESVVLEVSSAWADYIVVYPEDNVVVYRVSGSSSAGEAAVRSPELVEKYIQLHEEKQ